MMAPSIARALSLARSAAWTESWRSVAAARTAVERREASGPRRSRGRAPLSAAHGWCACRRSASLRSFPFVRETDFLSSLPGLTRQSMRDRRTRKLLTGISRRHFSMAHRVKPGGDQIRQSWAQLGRLGAPRERGLLVHVGTATVMPALGAGIHVFVRSKSKPWMAGSSPAMTRNVAARTVLRAGSPLSRGRAASVPLIPA